MRTLMLTGVLLATQIATSVGHAEEDGRGLPASAAARVARARIEGLLAKDGVSSSVDSPAVAVPGAASNANGVLVINAPVGHIEVIAVSEDQIALPRR